MGYPPSGRCGPVACKVVRLQGCGDGALRSTRHQVGGPGGVARFRDGALRSARHQVGVALVGLQGSGMVLYGLPAIRSVWFLGLQGCEVARFRDGAL